MTERRWLVEVYDAVDVGWYCISEHHTQEQAEQALIEETQTRERTATADMLRIVYVHKVVRGW